MKRTGMLTIGLVVGGMIILFGDSAQAGYEGNLNTFYGDQAGEDTDGDMTGYIHRCMGRMVLTRQGAKTPSLALMPAFINTTGQPNTFIGNIAGGLKYRRVREHLHWEANRLLEDHHRVLQYLRWEWGWLLQHHR